MLVATLVAAQPIPSIATSAAHTPCPASRGSTAAPASATAAPAALTALTALATSTITTTTLATISIATRPLGATNFAASQPPPPEGLGLASVRVPHLGIARGRGSLEAQILLAPGPIYLPDCLLDADQ